MTEEDAVALRQLYRESYPELATFWQDLGRQAHWELTVIMTVGYDPQKLLPKE